MQDCMKITKCLERNGDFTKTTVLPRRRDVLSNWSIYYIYVFFTL